MPRTVRFAGIDWAVKAGRGLGPGPNDWSDDPRSLWVDDAGLHLRIRRDGDRWLCAEATAGAVARFGPHLFRIATPLDRLDPIVSLGLFLYRDDDREIDIEFARWGNPAAANAQYVVQPALPGRIHRFPWSGPRPSVHRIDWGPGSVAFASGPDRRDPPGDRPSPGEEWIFSGGPIPQESAGLRIHINLWLFRGRPPTDGTEVETVISRMDFPQPLPAEPPG